MKQVTPIIKTMKKRNGVLAALIPLIITISLYLVFYSRIESRPNHVGFWFILAMGIALGVLLARLNQWAKEKDKA
jgi:hypothetical protein